MPICSNGKTYFIKNETMAGALRNNMAARRVTINDTNHKILPLRPLQQHCRDQNILLTTTVSVSSDSSMSTDSLESSASYEEYTMSDKSNRDCDGDCGNSTATSITCCYCGETMSGSSKKCNCCGSTISSVQPISDASHTSRRTTSQNATDTNTAMIVKIMSTLEKRIKSLEQSEK